MFKFFKHIHFVAIGGSGISPIAEVWLRKGYEVSGSDQYLNESTERLEKLGAKIYKGHDASNLAEDVDLLVYSSAIREDNPELREAARRGIPFVKRPEMLTETMRLKYGIGISGTHGKTTTTSMTATVLIEAGLDPTVIVGGRLKILDGGNARLGGSEFLVIEADEYDRTFLSLTPVIAVITNVEAEHLDTYKDLDDIKNTFIEYANKVPFYGFVAACTDEENVVKILPDIKKRVITYGTKEGADVRAVNISAEGRGTSFDVICKGKELGNIKLNVPGLHNIKNSLAAITVATELNTPFSVIKSSLLKFSGAARRFEVKYDGSIMVIDDYGHHPTETGATVSGIKKGWSRRLITVFQPHNYTRTRDFYKDFAASFMQSDIFICTDIYTSREEPIAGVSGELIIKECEKLGHQNIKYIKDKKDVPAYLSSIKAAGDIVLTIGAGDIYKYGEIFIDYLKAESGN